MNHTTQHSVVFDDVFAKPVHAQFDQQDSSSDGGALLLKAADQSLGLIQALGNCIREDRQLGKIKHSLQDLIQQRVFGIACGYEDCNDAARLSHDPVHRLMMGRDPLNGKALASQPTLSRFENAIEGRSLVRMGHALADRVIKRHRKRLGKRVRKSHHRYGPDRPCNLRWPATELFSLPLRQLVLFASFLPWLWVPLDTTQIMFLLISTILAGCGHFAMTSAFAHGEASFIAPFEYTALLWAIMFDLLIWQHIPGATTLVGATFIVGSGLYVAYREQLANRTRIDVAPKSNIL